MFRRSRQAKTATPLSAALAEQLDEDESSHRGETVADAVDGIDVVITKVYDDAYARAVSDMLATLQERIDELTYHLDHDEDAHSANLLVGLKDAIVTIEAS